MHLAVNSLLRKLWQVAKVVGSRMFNNNNCARLNHLAVENKLRQLWQLRQVVGWIGKNEVVLAGARSNEPKHIAPYLYKVFFLKQFFYLANEVVLS